VSRHEASGARWAIASPHLAATRAGAEAFEAGGNALDAALAAAVTLAVAYPHMCGVGGDLFAVLLSVLLKVISYV
jgi:gamma-glutamyltranspeptidase